MLLLLGVVRVRVDQWLAHGEDYSFLAKVIEEEGVDLVFLLPTEAAQLVDHWSPRPFPIVKQMIVGAMPVTVKLVSRIMPSCKILTILYASTELQVISYNTIICADQFQDFDSGVFCPEEWFKVLDNVGKGQDRKDRDLSRPKVIYTGQTIDDDDDDDYGDEGKTKMR
ncbi:hypothetical protein PoB_002195900 [Plakobranchus ocellatus]|uniref:AMP-dependent synthetase/ligase domain-containing protein n=1 Tax=Plakobranchus ocellatus TaxID=259542 RepID=A0AAV3ZNK6_9GAST|nr:hypothetical protein PoB_002195900 [Plakobranchus ocellatus]